jgi:hypothetical protein
MFNAVRLSRSGVPWNEDEVAASIHRMFQSEADSSDGETSESEHSGNSSSSERIREAIEAEQAEEEANQRPGVVVRMSKVGTELEQKYKHSSSGSFVEEATSSRSKCRCCGTTIEKGELRLATWCKVGFKLRQLNQIVLQFDSYYVLI